MGQNKLTFNILKPFIAFADWTLSFQTSKVSLSFTNHLIDGRYAQYLMNCLVEKKISK